MNTEGLTLKEYCEKRLFNWCVLKGYSQGNTFPVYKGYLNMILNSLPEPEKIGLLEIQKFALSFKNDHTRRMICILIRWLYDNIYKKPIDFRDLPYPKRRIKVQPIYAQENILKVLSVIKNPKHKAIIGLMIDQGLRVSEPCKIHIADYTTDKIILRSAKGDNDRIIYPSAFAFDLIEKYLTSLKEKPKHYLFEGQLKGQPYTTSSIRTFLEFYCRLAKVEYLGTHAIRRMTGTWWVENKVPDEVAAKKLGHQSVKTLHRHYIIHSPTYLKNIPTPLTE